MPRTSTLRAAIVLWGGWLVVTAVVFSYMQGTVHPYYTVALAPAIGALIAVTGRAVWEHNRTWFARIAMSGVVAATGAWTYVVLDRDPTWFPALRYAVAISTVVACIGLLVGLPRVRKGAAVVVLAAGLAGLTGPVAYSVQTAATPHTGATPSAGPAGAGMSFGGRALGTGRPGVGAVQGAGPGGASAPAPSGAGAPARAGGSFGGGDQTVSTALQTLLRASTVRWFAATTGAQSAASLELAIGTSIMGIDGFTDSDPAPTLAQFEAYVASGEIGYFIAGNGGGQGGPGASSGTGDQISAWVAANFAATTVGGQTVYNLGAATN
jgi:4-amino-4-deoxy-L-arabinose transferase-like glycosyltransferase